MRGAFTVARYLTMNSLGVLRRGRARVAAFLLAALLAGLYALIAVLAAYRGDAFAYARRSLSVQGLDKRSAVETLAAFQALSLAVVGLLPRTELTVSEEAEYEVLLTLPVTMREYVLGRTLHQALQSLAVQLVFLVPGAFYAAVFSAGNAAKVLLLPASFFLYVVFTEVAAGLVNTAKLAMRGKAWALRAAFLAYLVASAAHSAVTGAVSPLLVYPALLPASSLVHCFTVSESVGQVAAETGLLGLAVAALVAAQYALAGFVSPEDVKPLSEKVRRLRLGRLVSARIKTYSSSPGASVLRVVFLRPLVGAQGALAVAGAVAGWLAGVAARALAPRLDPLSLAVFAVVFSMMVILVELQLSVQEDFSPLWLYRSVPVDLRYLALASSLKVFVYSLASFLAAGLLLFSYTGERVYLLLPLSSVFASATAGVATTLLVALVMSKRRVVRYSSRGFYLVEDALALLLLAVSASLSALGVSLFELAAASGERYVALYALSSAVAGAVVLFVGVGVAGELLEERDVAQ